MIGQDTTDPEYIIAKQFLISRGWVERTDAYGVYWTHEHENVRIGRRNIRDAVGYVEDMEDEVCEIPL